MKIRFDLIKFISDKSKDAVSNKLNRLICVK